MNEWATPRLVARPAVRRERVWIAAVLLFGVGDVVTTSVGLATGGVAEIGPATAPLIAAYGLGAMLAVKLLAFGVFFLLWRVVPRPHCAGVPVGLALLGLAVTAWNLVVLGLGTLA